APRRRGRGPSGAAGRRRRSRGNEGDRRRSRPYAALRQRSYARIADARRIRISLTADAERRPSLWSRSKTGNELRTAITSSASLSEQPGRRASDEARLAAIRRDASASAPSSGRRFLNNAGFAAQALHDA